MNAPAPALQIVPKVKPKRKKWPVSPTVPKLDPDCLSKEQSILLIRRFAGRSGDIVWHTTGRVRFWYGLCAFLRSLSPFVLFLVAVSACGQVTPRATVHAVGDREEPIVVAPRHGGEYPDAPPDILTRKPAAAGVDVWSFIAGDTGREVCLTRGGLCQTSSYRSASRALYTRSDGLAFVYERDRERVAVVSDGEPTWQRLFSEKAGSTTPAKYAPSSMPLAPVLPVLPAGSVNPTRVTVAGLRTFAFKSFFVRSVDPKSCAIGPSWGAIATSSWLFVLASYDFGGDVGAQANVLVVESISGYPAGTIDPTHGMRLERYYFVKGYGFLQEEGWEDQDCRLNPTPAICSGNFYAPSPGAATWRYVDAPSVSPRDLCVR